MHDKATGRAYYLGRPTDAQVAVQRRQIEHRMAALGELHGGESWFISNGAVSGPLCWEVRDRDGKLVSPGAGPIYSEHQRYGAAYVTAWETARDARQTQQGRAT
jgi:hypothetical protein